MYDTGVHVYWIFMTPDMIIFTFTQSVPVIFIYVDKVGHAFFCAMTLEIDWGVAN